MQPASLRPAFAAAVLLSLSACAGVTSPVPSSPSAVPAVEPSLAAPSPTTIATPEPSPAASSQTPTSTAAAGSVEVILDARRRDYGAPGALAVLIRDGERTIASSGNADLAGTAITEATRFRIASITKPIVAALAHAVSDALRNAVAVL